MNSFSNAAILGPVPSHSLAMLSATSASSYPTDGQNCIERMMSRMELHRLRPHAVSTFTGCARRFLARVGKAPAVVTAADVESFLLELCRKGSTPSTRNANLAAVRCLLVGEHDLRPTRSDILAKATTSTDYTHRSRTTIA